MEFDRARVENIIAICSVNFFTVVFKINDFL